MKDPSSDLRPGIDAGNSLFHHRLTIFMARYLLLWHNGRHDINPKLAKSAILQFN
jgi:hypothetical protein